ncbi:phosphatase PAP2 family protein [Spirosoma linguale]|uniref:Phosphoesterase PA-phosphatase related protein n=1 Tax=Spirosoma linguale (strain ATCC 33905 / DSM 74 / LMG 10896 / Claus 1) TaxID=504472 RepID=D2QPH9_SPILD|nr:phosphoesterase PA-phosphatase related protein [Spirosoma linguale DSM 74]
MKTSFSSILLSALFLCVSACKEPIIDEGILPFITPSSPDADGGAWSPIVLKSAAAISVPQPDAVTSAAYQQELTGVKNGVLSSTPEQNTAVNFWAVGGVLRWNQIARQLVAKYNNPPGYDILTGQLNDSPTANPLAGPPFAARVYALLSVAQYDALVVAWRAKYQYNRPSLEQQGVIARIPILDVPSYPSEDAAIAEASYQVLAFFFPTESAWLKARATEHKQSRIWAGANVPTDVKAGEDLATAVTANVLDRAKTDWFSRAQDPTNSWQTKLASAPYDRKWTSLELPARAPVLPLAGQVKTWFDSTAIARTIPGPPPATTSTAFQTALGEVRDLANARTREQWRLASYWDNGPGTYSLSGLWNFLAEDLIRQNGQNELRTARTYALLNRAIQDATTAAWRTKYTYFTPRPAQLDPTIKTATAIPNTPGFVSDQAAASASAAAVLAYLFPDEAANLNAKATEAALSGLYAGTYTRFDTEAGTALGNTIGQMAVTGAKVDGAR